MGCGGLWCGSALVRCVKGQPHASPPLPVPTLSSKLGCPAASKITLSPPSAAIAIWWNGHGESARGEGVAGGGV